MIGLIILLYLLEGSHDYLVGGDLGIGEVVVLLHGLLQPLIKDSQPQDLQALTVFRHSSSLFELIKASKHSSSLFELIMQYQNAHLSLYELIKATITHPCIQKIIHPQNTYPSFLELNIASKIIHPSLPDLFLNSL